MAKPGPPISRRVVAVGAAVLGLTLAAIVVDGRRTRRSGELLVQSDCAGLRVTIRRGGRPVEGPTGKRSFLLPPGDYEIESDGVPTGRVSVVRGRRAVWRVNGGPCDGR